MCVMVRGWVIEEWVCAAVVSMPAVVEPSGLMNVDRAVFMRSMVAVQSEYPAMLLG